jgi:uncharacterized protein YndB with AHSA1/START domain
LGYVVRIERAFDAPAEAVFDAWTSAEVMRRSTVVQRARAGASGALTRATTRDRSGVINY